MSSYSNLEKMRNSTIQFLNKTNNLITFLQILLVVNFISLSSKFSNCTDTENVILLKRWRETLELLSYILFILVYVDFT